MFARIGLYIVRIEDFRHFVIHTNIGHHPNQITLNVLFEEQTEWKFSRNSIKEFFELTRPIVLRISHVVMV
jgi:S-adenosylhomocysteine hydrolase